jgi:TRAP transporter TAXI family solute receptor
MFSFVQSLIFIIIFATFVYTQKDKIVDKFNSIYSNINLEGFTNNKNGFGGFAGFTNLFSLEKPKIISNEINISNKNTPIITLSADSNLKNQVSMYLQNLAPMRQREEAKYSVSTLKDINEKKADLMVCTEDLVYNAITGKRPFYDTPLKNLRFVSGLFYETFILITYPEAGINSWKDIKGKIIGFPSNESGSFLNGNVISQAYGLEAGKDFRYINVNSMNRLSNLFFQRKIDAMYLTTSNKNPYLLNLAKKMSLKFIGTNDIDEKILKSYFPCSVVKYINTNHYYTNINTSSFIKTHATRAVLVVNKDLSDEYVYDLTKNLIQKAEELKDITTKYLYNRDKLNILEDSFMPSEMINIYDKIEYHPGAIKYYNELYDQFNQPSENPITFTF